MGDGGEPARHVEGELLALEDAGAGDEGEGVAADGDTGGELDRLDRHASSRPGLSDSPASAASAPARPSSYCSRACTSVAAAVAGAPACAGSMRSCARSG